MPLTLVLVQIVLAWLIADFLTGAVHWFEDRYMDRFDIGFLNRIAKENDLHHKKPTAMLLSSPWMNIKSSAMVAWPIAGVLAFTGSPLWLWLSVFFASFGNLVHRWSHTPKDQLHPLIRFGQDLGIFISHEMHDSHHRSMKLLIEKHEAGINFCPMSEFVNPILDGIRFWKGAEWSLAKLGLKTTEAKRGVE